VYFRCSSELTFNDSKLATEALLLHHSLGLLLPYGSLDATALWLANLVELGKSAAEACEVEVERAVEEVERLLPTLGLLLLLDVFVDIRIGR
jgi:hypothetical protein